MRKWLLAIWTLCLAPNLAQSAEFTISPGFNVNADGLFWVMFGHSDQDAKLPDGVAAKRENAVARADLRFNPEYTFLSGLQLGGVFAVDVTNRDNRVFTGQSLTPLSGAMTPYVDSQYLYLQAKYGRFVAGQVYGVGDSTAIVAPVSNLISGINQSAMGVAFESNPAAQEVVGASGALAPHYAGRPFTTTTDFMDDAPKVMYFTPRLVGVTVGLSYTPIADPNGYGRSAAIQRFNYLNAGGQPNPVKDAVRDATEFGISYDHAIAGVGITGAATYAIANDPLHSASREDTTAWNLGVNFAMGDLTLGGSYGAIQGAILGRAFDPTSALSMNLTQGHKIEQYSYDLGGTYALSNWTLGVNYAYGEAKIPAVISGNPGLMFRTPNTYGTEFSVDYNLLKGLNIISAVQLINYEAGNLPGEQFPNRSATNILLGTQLKF